MNQYYFYYKNSSRKIVPIENLLLNSLAKTKLQSIFQNYYEIIPSKFISNWESVKLYDPKGNIDKAHMIILNENDGSYNLNNKLNHLTGKEWTKFTCSWFLFNALHKDLKEEREVCKNCTQHPATYSPTMMEQFIKFFTKEKMAVLDPFMGIGSTLVACKRCNRLGYGIELNNEFYHTALKRVPEFKNNMICGDSRNITNYFENKKFNFCISSPPYWDVLNRSTAKFKKTRIEQGLNYNYSNNDSDLGNINDYNIFLNEISKIYLDIYDLLEENSYLVIIVKNIKKEGKLYPLAWDLAKILSNKYILKDEKIWIQDKISLAPYGYPHTWVSNILHHYCLILKKE